MVMYTNETLLNKPTWWPVQTRVPWHLC